MDKLIEIAVMVKSMFDVVNYQRLLSKLAILITLAMTTGLLASMLTAGLFYAVYQLLVSHGLETNIALVFTGIGAATATVIFATVTITYARNIRLVFHPLSPVISDIGDIVGAFLEGLRTSSQKGIR